MRLAGWCADGACKGLSQPVGDISPQPVKSRTPARLNSYSSIELSARTAVPDWNGQEVYIVVEDDAVLTPNGMRLFIPRQT